MWDMSTEAETRTRRRKNCAMIPRCLETLSRGSTAPIDHGSSEHRHAKLEQTFDNGIYQFK